MAEITLDRHRTLVGTGSWLSIGGREIPSLGPGGLLHHLADGNTFVGTSALALSNTTGQATTRYYGYNAGFGNTSVYDNNFFGGDGRLQQHDGQP